MSTLTDAARRKIKLQIALREHEATAKAKSEDLQRQIRQCALVLETAQEGLDADKLALAKTIIIVRGTYERAGDDRSSVIRDAIAQLATGEPIREHYGDLWRVYFGTKSYDRWHGQRCDCEYGCGPRHGSIIFAIEISRDARERGQAALTPAEIEAAIYYLTNLSRVQAAEARCAA